MDEGKDVTVYDASHLRKDFRGLVIGSFIAIKTMRGQKPMALVRALF